MSLPNQETSSTTAQGAPISISDTYQDARKRFLSLVRETEAQIETYTIPDLMGLNGEKLHCDVATFGGRQNSKRLIVSSGVHGIEGFCGSAIQCGLLEHGIIEELVEGISITLVHAVNPYGFSHFRRVNEDNVDVNRNFVHYEQVSSESEKYLEFRLQFFPEIWRGSDLDDALKSGREYLLAMGRGDTDFNLSKGQYFVESDPFFGGKKAVWSNQIWNKICEEIGRHSKSVIHLDIHSGLGRFGECELIFGGDPATSSLDWAYQIFGQSNVKVPSLGNSKSEDVSGPLASHLNSFDLICVPIGLEFGVLSLKETVDALIADNWLAYNPDIDELLRLEIRNQMKRAFFSTDPIWLKQIWEESVTNFKRAVSGFALVSDK